MPAKDCYVVLGVSRAETGAGIRAAYHLLARQLHPEQAGIEAMRAFQEITEAYEVLSDPRRRHEYNESLRSAEDLVTQDRARQTGPWWEAEPLPEAPWEPVSILSDPTTVRPSLDALAERLMRNFTGIHVPKAERREALNMDLVLTPAEVVSGLVVDVKVPVVRTCPACGGARVDWSLPCLFCDERGTVQMDQVVRVRIPPSLRPGAVLEVPLDELGIRNLGLRFHVSVAAHPLW
jgi:DnaJ-class molecular chaperone